MKNILLLTTLIFFHVGYSQNVGVGTATPHGSAAIEVQSTDKGMLVPRIALTAANVAAPVNSPADALLVYNTATSGNMENTVSPGFYYWSSASSRWIAMRTADVNNSPGFGNWGDCSVKNVSGYDAVTAGDGVDLDLFGSSVAISGNWAVVGARGDGTGGITNHGAAYFFFFDGTKWIQRQKVLASDAASNDGFGAAVSISGNYAVIGAPTNDVAPNPDQGSVYIFFYNGSTWVQTQQLFHPTPSFGDSFGWSVCMRGTFMIVGAPNDMVGSNGAQGSAQSFTFNGSSWVHQGQLVATDGDVADHFGRSVSIDGNRAIVGAPDDDGALVDQGAAYVFLYIVAWTQQQKFINTVFPEAGDNYGASVSISGTNCVVGCPNSNAFNLGFIDVWNFGSIVWNRIQHIFPPLDISQSNQFVGRSVMIEGDYFITAASGADVNNVEGAGRIFIYKNNTGIWRLYEAFSDPAAGPVDALGSAVALNNNSFVCSSVLAPDQEQQGLVIFGKIEF